jgi:predicted acetyltransferase
MSVEIKVLNEPEEFLQANINDAIVFNDTIDVDSDELKKATPNADTYGVFAEGKLVSHMIAHHYSMMCHGKYVPMCGIGSVCSLMEFRNKGYIRQLFEVVLDNACKAGDLYSYLYPFSSKYYNMFGYGTGVSRLKAEIPLERLDGYRCDYDVKMYRPGDSYEPYREVFEKFAVQYTGNVARNDSTWMDDYVPTKSYKSLFLFSDNGTPKAFLGYRNYHKQEGHLLVSGDIAWEDSDSFRNILGFLYKLRMHNDKVVIDLPESFPLELMLSEQWGVKINRFMTGQVRTVDVAGAFKAYPWTHDKGEIRIGVRDDFLVSQSGVFHVCFGDNETYVNRCDGMPDIELDVKVLSPLLMGVYGFSDLAYVPPGLVTVNRNAELLERLFKRHPTFITEQF